MPGAVRSNVSVVAAGLYAMYSSFWCLCGAVAFLGFSSATTALKMMVWTVFWTRFVFVKHSL